MALDWFNQHAPVAVKERTPTPVRLPAKDWFTEHAPTPEPAADAAGPSDWFTQHAPRDVPPVDDLYDYEAAKRAGAKPDASGHWPSEFKKPGHPNLIVGGFDTRTGARVPGTPRMNEADLVAHGWDSATARELAKMPEPSMAAPLPTLRGITPGPIPPPPDVALPVDFAPADPLYAPVDVTKPIREGVPQIGRGVVGLAQSGAIPMLATAMGTPLQPEPAANAISDLFEGSMTLGSPLIIPALASNPILTVATVALATAASDRAVQFAKDQGWDEPYQRLAGNAAAAAVVGVGGHRIAKGYLRGADAVAKSAGEAGVKIGTAIRQAKGVEVLPPEARPPAGLLPPAEGPPDILVNPRRLPPGPTPEAPAWEPPPPPPVDLAGPVPRPLPPAGPRQIGPAARPPLLLEPPPPVAVAPPQGAEPVEQAPAQAEAPAAPGAAGEAETPAPFAVGQTVQHRDGRMGRVVEVTTKPDRPGVFGVDVIFEDGGTSGAMVGPGYGVAKFAAVEDAPAGMSAEPPTPPVGRSPILESALPPPATSPAVPPPDPATPVLPATAPPVATVSAKEPWQMTRAEFAANQGGSSAYVQQQRDAVVKHAVKAGKPVPPDVLAEYPELATPRIDAAHSQARAKKLVGTIRRELSMPPGKRRLDGPYDELRGHLSDLQRQGDLPDAILREVLETGTYDPAVLATDIPALAERLKDIGSWAPDLLPFDKAQEARELRRMLTELDAIPYEPTGYASMGDESYESIEFVKGQLQPGQRVIGTGHGSLLRTSGHAGAPVYTDIVQYSPGTSAPTRGQLEAAIRNYLETGKRTNAVRGALAVARIRMRVTGTERHRLAAQPMPWDLAEGAPREDAPVANTEAMPLTRVEEEARGLSDADLQQYHRDLIQTPRETLADPEAFAAVVDTLTAELERRNLPVSAEADHAENKYAPELVDADEARAAADADSFDPAALDAAQADQPAEGVAPTRQELPRETREAWEVPADELIQYKDTLAKPKNPPPADDADMSEAAMYARALRYRRDELDPPTVPQHPVGSWGVDSTGELMQLREYDIDDPILRFNEGEKKNATSQKYADWIAQGSEPPPLQGLETEKGSVNIQEGHHRWSALKQAGRDKVRVWVSITRNVDIGNGVTSPRGVKHEDLVREHRAEMRRESDDDQPILPGTESARSTENATPEFDLPFSLTAPKRGLGKKVDTPELPEPGRDAYDASLDTFRAASAAFREAQRAYRAGEIDDAAFLAAREKFDAEDKASDQAEAEIGKAAKGEARSLPTAQARGSEPLATSERTVQQSRGIDAAVDTIGPSAPAVKAETFKPGERIVYQGELGTVDIPPNQPGYARIMLDRENDGRIVHLVEASELSRPASDETVTGAKPGPVVRGADLFSVTTTPDERGDRYTYHFADLSVSGFTRDPDLIKQMQAVEGTSAEDARIKIVRLLSAANRLKRPAIPGVTEAVGDQPPPVAAKSLDDKGAQPYELTEADYLERRRQAEIRRYERGIAEIRKEIDGLTARTSEKTRASKEGSLTFWEANLAKFQAGDLSYVKASWLSDYAKTVKDAISTGKPVPTAIIAQRPEFIKARDGRERYDKGRHTSFANQSVAVDTSTVAEHGFKVKRQDGKPTPKDQIAEIVEGMDVIHRAIGDTKDLLIAYDPTIAHTNGKHPFMRGDAGGLYSIGDRTLSVGMTDMLGHGVLALAHEYAHFLDITAGFQAGVVTRSRKGKAWFDNTSLAEVDARQSSLIREATQKINQTEMVRRVLAPQRGEKQTDIERSAIERAKVQLGPYWREPREVFARLVEQYVANQAGTRTWAAEGPNYYAKAPGWWTQEDFDAMRPKIEAAVRERIQLLRDAKPKSEK